MTKNIPLFPDEEFIATLVLGPGKVREWKSLAEYLEPRGLPKPDPITGKRFWPAVEAFFRKLNNLDDHAQIGTTMSSRVRILDFAPDGPETPHAANTSAPHHRRSERRIGRARA